MTIAMLNEFIEKSLCIGEPQGQYTDHTEVGSLQFCRAIRSPAFGEAGCGELEEIAEARTRDERLHQNYLSGSQRA